MSKTQELVQTLLQRVEGGKHPHPAVRAEEARLALTCRAYLRARAKAAKAKANQTEPEKIKRLPPPPKA